MKLIDHITSKQYNYKQAFFYNEENDKAMYDFLDQYRIDGEELEVNMFYDGYIQRGTQHLTSKKYEIFFKDIPRFKKLFGADMRGSLIVWIGASQIGIYLNVPSLNILSNYHHYIDAWMKEVYNGRTKPVWGSCNNYWFDCQRLSKDVATVPTAIKWFETYLAMAEDMMKKGISWSNTKEIQDEFDYSYDIQSKIWKLNDQISSLATERDGLENQFDSYRKRIKENFKKEREMMKDF